MDLRSLGFRRNWIYETIITTESGGRPHAAPMGVSSRNLKTLILSIYKTSETYRNIDATGFFAVNLTDDVELFYDSLFNRKKLRFRETKKLRLPCIYGVDGVIGARIKSEKDLGDKMFYEAEMLFYEGLRRINLVNRGKALAFEALIKASKIDSFKGEEREKLIEELRYIVLASSKVAPKSSFARICSEVLSRF